ncbi:hypothetical protein D9613_001395 [Agrocybe pediades]|uniref:CxC5 like cysteine cluster associated with KDZ domain-containing protein n=1 Tax=Agrocybe pediades TaxID=84607 RepID=A0A8H4R811_9AGAR|nr:hypothetical protein D9613_001395 [Agrocybe pediades]
MELSTFLSTLTAHPEVAKHLDFNACLAFIELIQLLKPALQLYLNPDFEEPMPLSELPVDILKFFELSLDLDHESAKMIWEILCPIAWALGSPSDIQAFGRRYMQLFLDYGLSRGVAFFTFIPPTRTCLDPGCNSKTRTGKKAGVPYSRELYQEKTVAVTVFTQDFGPVPGLSVSFSCKACNTHYYPTYYVDGKKKLRMYYRQDKLVFVHSATHHYIEKRTLDNFTTSMLVAWTSAGNCARIYNDGVGRSITLSLPVEFENDYHIKLDTEDVWAGLMLHWLLEDAEERQQVLELPEDARSQSKRLQFALRQRNKRMAGTGQEAWNHACNLCCWITVNASGQQGFLRSTVTDGVTIGRPACSSHDCESPLKSVKDRFCPAHADQDLLCVVITTCSCPAEKGYRTCADGEHRRLEDYNSEKEKAMFQLKERLARLRTSQPREGIPQGAEDTGRDEEVIIDQDGVCDTDKPEEGNQKLRARFGRRRSHNEELCVASCGVIIGRETFYGSEAPTKVVSFWKKLFPTQRSLPGVLWHDNNCRIVAMLNNPARPDKYFENSALPVDVFHFKCKHKKTDDHCNEHCNPANWSELYTPEGTWRFNSSAAEQANAWIGGYQTIVREMQADRYDFFLDEMIKRRNRNLISDLEKRNTNPFLIPREVLLCEDPPQLLAAT